MNELSCSAESGMSVFFFIFTNTVTLAETETKADTDSCTMKLGLMILLGSGYIEPTPRPMHISIGSAHLLSVSSRCRYQC